MNRKHIIAVIVVLLAAGAGIVALVKSRGGASESGGDDATPTLVSVQTGALKLTTLHRYVQGFGTVEPAPATADQPAADAPLAAPSAGVVTKVNVVAGQSVKKGDVLVELNSSTTTAENAEQEVARQKELFAQQNTSQKNLQAAEAQLALLRVTAPLSGTVARLDVKPGQAVDLSTVVAEVMDLSRLAARAEIPAAEADGLKAGEEVQVLSEPAVTTELLFVSPDVDKDNGTVLVRALLPADSGLRPGQFVPLRIVTAVHTNESEQTPVHTGWLENGWVEIAAPGLKAGDTVVTVGAYGLPEKTKISVQNSTGDETASTNSADAK